MTLLNVFKAAPVTRSTAPGKVNNPMLKSASIDKMRTKRLPTHARVVFRLHPHAATAAPITKYRKTGLKAPSQTVSVTLYSLEPITVEETPVYGIPAKKKKSIGATIRMKPSKP